MSKYVFTSDWFTGNIPHWDLLLAHLSGLPIQCLEVGTYEGRSALWIADHLLAHPDATLTCIDPWLDANVEAQFDRNLSACARRGQIVKLKGDSGLELRRLPADAFDLIYIDGSHEGMDVLEDAVLSFRLLRAGGVLGFDDYTWNRADHYRPPKPAIDAFLDLWSRHIVLLHWDGQVIVQRVY